MLNPIEKEKKKPWFQLYVEYKIKQKDKWINKTKQKPTHIYRKQDGCYWRKRGWENELDKGVQIHGNRRKLESGKNAIEYTDNELQCCTPDIYILSNVTSMK